MLLSIRIIGGELYLIYCHSSEMATEVYEWLRSTSNGLNLERLTKEFEVRGFMTQQSLEYVQKEDLDSSFLSPQKLLLAEKYILRMEINNLKDRKNLPPKELFPVVQNLSENSTKPANDEATGAQALLSTATSFSLAYQTTQVQLDSPKTAQLDGFSSGPSNNNYLDKQQVQLTRNGKII